MKSIYGTALSILAGTILITAQSAAGIPRETQSLDGPWQIVFDPGNEGRDKGWFRNKDFPQAQQREITVPSCWELIEKDYEGVAFYRRSFKVPADWKQKVVRLQFDAVNFRSEVWLNDVAVGMHEGGFTPFEFRIDDLLKFDKENTLILRVVGPILLQDKKVDGVGPLETPQWRGAIAGGIWQPVRLIATGDAFVADVFIEPKISDNTATLHVELEHAGENSTPAKIEIAIHSDDKLVTSHTASFKLKPGIHSRSWSLEIPDAEYWSPANPHLYHAEVTVTVDDAASDQWTARFGMREFTIRDKKFHLNGKPFYLKATFFEGLYPTKLAYPDSEEMARREIQLAKDAGFNMIRPWRKPPPPMWLDLAEEMGVLTVGSLVVECMDFPVESPSLPGWVENEVKESILRDRNRACVVQWELFNELKRPVLMRLLHPMAMLARELDPTRLILDESGGWAQGANIYLPYQSEPIKFNDIHDYPGPQVSEMVYDKLLLTGTKTHAEMKAMGLSGRMPGRNVVIGLMTYFSELGYGSLPELEDNNRRFAESGNPLAPPTIYHRRLADDHRKVLKESGFDEVFPTLKSFCLDQQQIHGQANRRMIEAVRCNPNVEGYCIHALTAGNWIIGAGLLDLFRNPKTDAYELTKAANQPRILSVRTHPRNVYAKRGMTLEITGVNELAPLDGTLSVKIIAADGTVVLTKSLDARLATCITPLFKEKLDTSQFSGGYTAVATFSKDENSPGIIRELDFDVFAPKDLAPPRKPFAVLDIEESLKSFLRDQGVDFSEFGEQTDLSVPVFVARTKATGPKQAKRFNQLADFIRNGGTGVYLEGGGPHARWGVAGPASKLLPVPARTKQAIGNWTCISHIVKKHPIFDGLPVNGSMAAIYGNVWAPNTLLDFPGEAIAGSIGYDWFPDYDLSKRHYYGTGDTWWGADLGIAKLGKGRCVASQLRIVDYLGKDPVADRLLFNMIRWATDTAAGR